jgi:hypothetical protein
MAVSVIVFVEDVAHSLAYYEPRHKRWRRSALMRDLDGVFVHLP